jgi:hypothetical protein
VTYTHPTNGMRHPENHMTDTHKIKVYTASHLGEADFWRQLRDDWPEVEFTARWPVNCVVDGQPAWPQDPSHGRLFWQIDHDDVARADVVLCYSRILDPLRGAIFEAGLAVGMGKRAIVVGEHPSYSTWQYHPAIYHAASIDHARSILRLMADDNSP